MIGQMLIIQITTITSEQTMSKRSTPLDRDAVKRIVKAEVKTHGRIRKGSHAAKVQSILAKQAEV